MLEKNTYIIQTKLFFPAVKPHNPMVNSGSIIVNSLLQTLMKPDMTSAEKFWGPNHFKDGFNTKTVQNLKWG